MHYLCISEISRTKLFCQLDTGIHPVNENSEWKSLFIHQILFYWAKHRWKNHFIFQHQTDDTINAQIKSFQTRTTMYSEILDAHVSVYERIFIFVWIEYQILIALYKLSESNLCCKIYKYNIWIVQNIQIVQNIRSK